jgi:tetratricopeptide (TPR) repeat protein
MKVFLLSCVFLITANLLAQQPSFYSQNVNLRQTQVSNALSFQSNKSTDSQDVKKKIAPSGIKIHLLPLFGNYEKTEDLKRIDDEFLKACDKNFKTRSEASNFFAQRAWEYLGDGEKDTATYRFNLAYLLDDENVDVYWGLGVIEFQKGNTREAIILMKNGLQIADNQNPTLMVDLATIYIQCYSVEKKTDDLAKAFDLLDEAIRQEPELSNAYMQLALAELVNGQPDKAWEAFHKGYELDPENLKPEILEALLAKKEDPKGIFK